MGEQASIGRASELSTKAYGLNKYFALLKCQLPALIVYNLFVLDPFQLGGMFARIS
jgi:hypothetical protein